MINFMLKYPFCVLCIGYLAMILMSVFVFVMGWLDYETPDDRELMVWTDEYVH